MLKNVQCNWNVHFFSTWEIVPDYIEISNSREDLS